MDDKSIDPKIAKAVKEVRGKVKRLERDARNVHADYNYASIDSYYERVIPIATEAGLLWKARETKFELVPGMGRGKDRVYVQASVAYDVFVEGACANDYMSLTVILPLEGAQTTGQIFSYTDKVFMRVTFGIATGEKDADANATEPTLAAPKQDKPRRFEDGDVPPGVDPITGEVLSPAPAPSPSKQTNKTIDLSADTQSLSAGTSREGDPIIDTRKIDDKSVEMVTEIFRKWLPSIKNTRQLHDWHAENVAAIEKVAQFSPAARDAIKGMFNERNLQLKGKK